MPFVIAFGVITLVISVLIVANVVGGAVVAGTTRIGVLKSIGFTPAQVVASYVLLVAVPAAGGAVAGAVCGNLPAVPRPVTLGFAAPAARPGRTLVTVAAVLFGAAAVTFGVGLATSLNRAYNDISLNSSLPVRVSALPPGFSGPAGPGGPPGPGRGKKDKPLVLVGPGRHLTAAQQHAVTTAINDQPGTLHCLSETSDQLSLPGLAGASGGGTQVTAYGGGDPSWSGIALISGRWYAPSSGAREVDVNTLFLTDTGTHVGGGYTLVTLLTLLITVIAGLGVLNTVALQIRERAHDIGVFKALGMTPRQTLAMVICSVGLTGLVAGIIAVPAGIYLHHGVIPAMTHAANSGYPPSLISVFSLPEAIGLALAGLAIAIAGALAPAGWAASARTATALRTE